MDHICRIVGLFVCVKWHKTGKAMERRKAKAIKCLFNPLFNWFIICFFLYYDRLPVETKQEVIKFIHLNQRQSIWLLKTTTMMVYNVNPVKPFVLWLFQCLHIWNWIATHSNRIWLHHKIISFYPRNDETTFVVAFVQNPDFTIFLLFFHTTHSHFWNKLYFI